jgi:DNA-binding NtrC family response regulator
VLEGLTGSTSSEGTWLASGARCLLIQHRLSPVDNHVLQHVLSPDRGFTCAIVSWDALALEVLPDYDTDVIVALAAVDPTPARRLFDWLADHPVRRPILAVLPSPPDEALIESAAGAVDDFVLLPVREEELRQRLTRMLSPARDGVEGVSARLAAEVGLRQLAGQDATFLRAIARLPRMALSDMPVLILGETGTGKELCARAIHHLSRRRSQPFIAVDCGAVPDHLFENELFGHARGAFTDAHRDQRGLIAMADGGTLFLDEIDALSPAAQAKLLRFLQERMYRPLGADRFARADVNVIAATNRDLEACVREQRFRSDLYFRLNVLPLQLPPLRQRRGDIPVLAHRFLQEAMAAPGVRARSFSPAALGALLRHPWPGNVRELQNVVRRAAVASESPQIRPADLALPGGVVEEGPAPPVHFRAARAAALEGFERRYIERLLRRHDGNVTRAAREAQKDRRAFGRLIKKYGIDKRARAPRFGEDEAY